MILGTFSYPFGQDFVMPRSRLIGVGVEWWNGFTIVTAGNPSRYHETVFGGYEVYVKVFDWVWDWSVKTIQIDNWIEDCWAYAPASSTPISFGIAQVYGAWLTNVRGWFLVVDFAPVMQNQWYQAMPGPPPGFYNPPAPVPATYPLLVP